MFPAGSQELADRSAAWIQQSLAEVGVGMKIEKVANDVFKDRRKKHEFDAAMATLVFDATPDRYDLYHSKARDGGFNYGGFADPGIDRLLDEARATVDPEARRAITFRLQQQLDDLQPVSFIFQYAQPVLLDSALEGVVPSSMGLFQFTPGPRAWHWSGTRRRP
jgi:peptide/nickel transport system substrate-binding protein